MITCRESKEASVLAAYGELDAKGQGALRSHLLECPECAADARHVKAARELVARAEGHDLPQVPVAGPVVIHDPAPRVLPVVRRARPQGLRWGVAAAIVIGVVVAASVRRGARESGEEQVSSATTTRPQPRRASPAAATDTVDSGSAATDDGFSAEIESLDAELDALESRVREF